MKICSECPTALERYFVSGFLRWPMTCGPRCAAKRKNRLQNERRLKKWEAELRAEGRRPFNGFKYPLPTDVCFLGAGKKQATATAGKSPSPSLSKSHNSDGQPE